MKLTLLLASMPLVGMLFLPHLDPPSTNPSETVKPKLAFAAAGAEVSVVGGDWGRQPWVENEVGLGSAPDVTGQGNPFIGVGAGGNELVIASLTSTVVFYYNGAGSATDFSFDEVLSVTDNAPTARQAAHSSVSGAGSLTGDDKNAGPYYPHEYTATTPPERLLMVSTFYPEVVRKVQIYDLSASASSTSDAD